MMTRPRYYEAPITPSNHKLFHSPEAYIFGFICSVCGCHVFIDRVKNINPNTVRCVMCHSPHCYVTYNVDLGCCC